jgi:hypothetical protein
MSDSQPTPRPEDPELEALLNFEPVPRKVKRPDGWTPKLQRQFIRLIVETGSPQRAAAAMGKKLSGIEALYRREGAESFRAAWDGAVDLATDRELAKASAPPFTGEIPGIARRTGARPGAEAGPLPGQVLNEHGEWEDEESIMRRVDEARDSISLKLLNCRRLYLQEISGSPGKRAAFEILTELPIHWEKAERLEPQDDEPWAIPNMREPDMLLTAENGWMGDMAHGPDKMAELRKAVDAHREEEGLPPVEWESDPEPVRDREAQSVTQTGAHRDGEDRSQGTGRREPHNNPGPRLRGS